MKNKKKVSIIIPAYNVGKYIERCIKSAMNQTLKDIEIIVINDGSTDNTLKILEKLKKEDIRIKIITKNNGGLATARNIGIKEASGEYIQHLDGDDWIDCECCSELYNLAKRENIDLILTDLYKEYKNGKIKYIRNFRKVKEGTVLNNIALKELSTNNLNVNILSKFIKRNLYIENNIKHPEGVSLGEDLATTPKIIQVSQKIKKINKAYYYYQYNSSSITNTNFSKKIGELFICFEELENFIMKEYSKDIKILKANHLANFFYKCPLKGNKEYLKNLNMFFKYVHELEKDILSEISILKKILYMISKNIKSEVILLKFIEIIFFFNKIRGL